LESRSIDGASVRTFDATTDVAPFAVERAFTMAPAIVQDPELSSRYEGGPQMATMQWRPFYVALELDPDDTDTSKWGNQRKVRKWISFEDLQEWHPDFMKDRY